jgi:hypothetical protein
MCGGTCKCEMYFLPQPHRQRTSTAYSADQQFMTVHHDSSQFCSVPLCHTPPCVYIWLHACLWFETRAALLLYYPGIFAAVRHADPIRFQATSSTYETGRPSQHCLRAHTLSMYLSGHPKQRLIMSTPQPAQLVLPRERHWTTESPITSHAFLDVNGAQ